MITIGHSCAKKLEEVIQFSPLLLRLSLSYGTDSFKSERARNLFELSTNAGFQNPIWAAVYGPEFRVGEIFKDGFQSEIRIELGEKLEIVDAQSIDLGIQRAVPIPNIFERKNEIGHRIIYGDQRGEFVVEAIKENSLIAQATTNMEITGRRSLHFPGQSVRQSELDENTEHQLRFVSEHADMFDGLILPDVTSSRIIDRATEFMARCPSLVPIACSIERKLEEFEFLAILEKSDFVILDRAKMAMTEGNFLVPEMVSKFLEIADKHNQKQKIFVASHIGSHVSKGRSEYLSSAEISEVWRFCEERIGGFVLTEETAVDPDYLQVISRVQSALMRYN